MAYAMLYGILCYTISHEPCYMLCSALLGYAGLRAIPDTHSGLGSVFADENVESGS